MPTTDVYDDAVVGAGVLGLAHAYHLARRGRKVVVLERDVTARGASIRNFGMLWPIGQPRGVLRDLADRSLSIWHDVLESSSIWHRRTGSLHLAYHQDEAQVLREFTMAGDSGERLELLEPEDAVRLAPRLRRDGLILALWSPHEVCVDPRDLIACLPTWLNLNLGVRFRFDTSVTEVRSHSLVTTTGILDAERIWICSGDEMRVLFPDHLRQAGMVRCKLQMLRSRPMGPDWDLGPMLAGGLTLRHYAAFRDCPGLERLKERVASQSPWLDPCGIHVMVSQNGRGELTIGDSHEYGEPIDPFDRSDIEGWILDYLRTFLVDTDLAIASRWHGSYAKHPERPYVVLEPEPNVLIITGVGGAGMTLSFGLAERVITQALRSS